MYSTPPPGAQFSTERRSFAIVVNLSRWRDLNPRPLPYQGSALPLSYIGNLYVCPLVPVGAEDEAQTRDPQLGRLMLYQLSYFRKFYCGQGQIRTAEAVRQQIYSLPVLTTYLPTQNFEPLVGFEPTTPRLQITCSGQLS